MIIRPIIPKNEPKAVANIVDKALKPCPVRTVAIPIQITKAARFDLFKKTIIM